jgi:hypothetical protein
MAERYPGYNVLNKRNTVSWNDQTRAVIDTRIRIDPELHQFCDEVEWKALRAICAQIIPQPADRPMQAPIAAMIDQKLHSSNGDGYRDSRLPEQDRAWRLGLAAIDAEAVDTCDKPFSDLSYDQQHWLLGKIQRGQVSTDVWQDMPPAIFFARRLLHDIISAYYAHPVSWNEIGFGGPASPRGYVRMNFDRRDPWEAAEASPGREDETRWENEHVG